MRRERVPPLAHRVPARDKACVTAPLPSPCTGVCTLAAGRCKGCGRTLDEIARWTAMTSAERAAVMKRLGR